jgi:hypothetical protein
MQRRAAIVSTMSLLIALGMVFSSFAQQEAREGAAKKGGKKGPARAPLFFREEWKAAPGAAEAGITSNAVSNPNLELKLYGGKQVELAGALGNEDNPLHPWTGLCENPCAVALRDKNNYVDLTGLAKIRWNTKVSGFHQIHPIVKLADGTWLVGDHASGSITDWHFDDFSVADVRWLRLDIEKVQTKGNFLANPDLSKVDEVGFTDLIAGSGHGPGGWSDVAQIEVYGKPVPR